MDTLVILLSNDDGTSRTWNAWAKGFHPKYVFHIRNGENPQEMRVYSQGPASFADIPDGTLGRVVAIGHGYAGEGERLEIGGAEAVADFIRGGIAAKVANACTMRIQICSIGRERNRGFLTRIVPAGVEASYPNDLSCLLYKAGQWHDLSPEARCQIGQFGALNAFLKQTFAHPNYLDNAGTFLEANRIGFSDRFAWTRRTRPEFAAHASPAVRDFFEKTLKWLEAIDSTEAKLDPQPGQPRLTAESERRNADYLDRLKRDFRPIFARLFAAMAPDDREAVYRAGFGRNTGRLIGAPPPGLAPAPPPRN